MRHTSHNRKTIGLVSTLALALVATASLGIASSPATAQTSTDLDAAKCESRAADGYLPQWNAYGETAIKQCESLVVLRNQLVGQSDLSPGHKLLQWGTGAQLKFNAWRGLSFTDGTNPNEREVDEINVSDEDNGILSGAIPLIEDEHPIKGDGRLFDEVELLRMDKGALTGDIQEWIYALRSLKILKLANNNLSGSVHGQSFATSAFEHIELGGNSFSGDVPAFKVRDNGNLVYLQLTSNRFSGPIPASYGDFVGREMRLLALGGNRISGNLPSWIGNLKWSDGDAQSQLPNVKWAFYLNGNRLCIPSGLSLAAMTEAGGTEAASMFVDLSGNICEGQVQPATLYTPRAPAVVSMEVEGSSVRVTWRPPSNTDTNTRYLLEGKELYPEALQGELEGIELSSKCKRIVRGTDAGSGLLTETLSVANGGPNCNFNPNYMAVNVRTVNRIGSRTDSLHPNVYLSAAEGRFGWNFTHVVREQPIQEIAYNLGMDTNQSISYWDGSNQRWRSYRVGQQSPNPQLAAGTPVAHSLVSQGWMDRIGVGSSGNDAFNDDGVTLYAGWNMISAGGEASGEEDDGAFMFDERLVDCDNLLGAIMILRYNPISRSYDVILPCHQSVQRSLIAGGAWGSIEDISEFDNLMIYYRAQLSVNIKWDAGTSQYVN